MVVGIPNLAKIDFKCVTTLEEVVVFSFCTYINLLCFSALVLPLMQYACLVWLPHYNKLFESVQNCCSLDMWCSFYFVHLCMVTSLQSMYVHTWMGFYECLPHHAVSYFYMILLRTIPQFIFIIIFNLIPAELALIHTHF